MARTRRRSRRRRNPPKGSRKVRGHLFRTAKGRFTRVGGKAAPKRRRRRRSKSASTAPRRRRRRSRGRGRGRRPTRYRSYRGLSRRYGPRKAARVWRRRRKFVRSNPGLGGFLPSFASGKALVKAGAVAYAGYVGTNGVMMLLDKIGVGTLKAKVTDPKVMLFVNFLERAVSGFIAARALGMVIRGGDSQRLLMIGAGVNVVAHAASDVVSTFNVALPTWGAPLLLGYSGGGMGNYMTANDFPQGGVAGMGNYITAGTAIRRVPGSLAAAGYQSGFPVGRY